MVFESIQMAQVRTETLLAAGHEGPVETFEVIVTRHGPLVSGDARGCGVGLAAKLTGIDPSGTRWMDSCLDILRANSADELEAAVAEWTEPVNNVRCLVVSQLLPCALTAFGRKSFTLHCSTCTLTLMVSSATVFVGKYQSVRITQGHGSPLMVETLRTNGLDSSQPLKCRTFAILPKATRSPAIRRHERRQLHAQDLTGIDVI